MGASWAWLGRATPPCTPPVLPSLPSAQLNGSLPGLRPPPPITMFASCPPVPPCPGRVAVRQGNNLIGRWACMSCELSWNWQWRPCRPPAPMQHAWLRGAKCTRPACGWPAGMSCTARRAQRAGRDIITEEDRGLFVCCSDGGQESQDEGWSLVWWWVVTALRDSLLLITSCQERLLFWTKLLVEIDFKLTVPFFPYDQW